MARIVRSKLESTRVYVLKWFYYYEKLIGLCPCSLDENAILKCSHIGIFYGAFLSIFYTVLFAYAVPVRYKVTSSQDSILFIFIDESTFILHWFLNIYIWLRFALRQDHFRNLIEDFKKILKLSEQLNISKDNRTIFITIATNTIITNLSYFAMLCCSTITFALNSNEGAWCYTNYEAIVWKSYVFMHVVNSNISAGFINFLLIVEWRLLLLNKRIKSESASSDLNMFHCLHIQICDFIDSTVHYLSLGLWLSMLIYNIEIFADLYYICIRTIKWTHWSTVDAVNFVNSLCWLTYNVLEIYLVCSLSDSVVQQANETGRILHRNVYFDKGKMLKITSLQLLQRHFEISVCGMYKLDFRNYVKVWETVILCLVFMFQLDEIINKAKMQGNYELTRY